jgi:hypothetical protein
MDRRCLRSLAVAAEAQGGSVASGALAALLDLVPALEWEGALRYHLVRKRNPAAMDPWNVQLERAHSVEYNGHTMGQRSTARRS